MLPSDRHDRGHGPGAARRDPEGNRSQCAIGSCRALARVMRAASLRNGADSDPVAPACRTRGQTLIVNLLVSRASIAECLDAVFPAIPYCIDCIGGRARHRSGRLSPSVRKGHDGRVSRMGSGPSSDGGLVAPVAGGVWVLALTGINALWPAADGCAGSLTWGLPACRRGDDRLPDDRHYPNWTGPTRLFRPSR